MTKDRAALPGRFIAGQEPFFTTLSGPKAHDSSGRDDNPLRCQLAMIRYWVLCRTDYSSRRTCKGFCPKMRKLATQPVAVANTAVPTSAIAVASHSM
jgi:hypothetical protein